MTALTILSTIITLLNIYLLIISFRIILSWFRTVDENNQLIRIVRKITDPYLSLFRGIKFLKLGMFDLSPMAGIVLLVIVQVILTYIEEAIRRDFPITFVLIIIAVLSVLWQSIAWILMLLIILCLIRAGSLFFVNNPSGRFWHVLDMIVQPISNGLEKIVRRDLKYTQALLISALVLIVFRFAGEFLITQLFNLLLQIPV